MLSNCRSERTAEHHFLIVNEGTPTHVKIDRFTLAMDVIDRVPKLKAAGAHAKEAFRNRQIACQNYAFEHGVDKPEAAN
jgi:phosphoketolase